MPIGFLLRKFQENYDGEAIIWRDQPFSYGWLLDRISHWQEKIAAYGIRPGTVTVVEADHSPNSVALLLALVDHACILVPLSDRNADRNWELIQIAQAEVLVKIDAEDVARIDWLSGQASHEIYDRLHAIGHPGLVLFTSGSTGESKAAVHDMTRLLEKFQCRRRSLRTICFLLYDHIGGINTLLYSLSNAGTIVTVQERSPDAVLAAVERHRAALLPTSPTFLNLILLSEAHKRHNLESLRTVTYGTEPMPESTLRRFNALFPRVSLLQTYGLSELGILRSKSRDSGSLWVKVGGEGFATRVVDGILQIQARSAMLGYLNAPSPFTDDGWFDTGDAVEADGEYIRILGRRSELINVGGEKVYPAEVESVIQEMDEVAEVTVHGEKNPITGNIVCATVTTTSNDAGGRLASRIKRHCRGRLAPYKVPIKIRLVHERQHGERFKKVRAKGSHGDAGKPRSRSDLAQESFS